MKYLLLTIVLSGVCKSIFECTRTIWYWCQIYGSQVTIDPANHDLCDYFCPLYSKTINNSCQELLWHYSEQLTRPPVFNIDSDEVASHTKFAGVTGVHVPKRGTNASIWDGVFFFFFFKESFYICLVGKYVHDQEVHVVFLLLFWELGLP